MSLANVKNQTAVTFDTDEHESEFVERVKFDQDFSYTNSNDI